MSNFFKSESVQKIKRFFKKQGYYILLAFCVVLVATVITLSVVLSPKDDANTPVVNQPGGDIGDSGNNDGNNPSVEKPDEINTFLLPVSGEYKEYSGWQTIGQMHQLCNYVAFNAEKGANVSASADGIVASVEREGDSYILEVFYTKQKLMAVYYGLDGNSAVAAKLKKGDVLSQGATVGVAKGEYLNLQNSGGNVIGLELYKGEAYNKPRGEEIADIMSCFVSEEK